MSATAPLTEKQQHYLEHLKRADELGASLREYADAYELKVSELYYRRRQLILLGALPGDQSPPGEFVEIKIEKTEPECTLPPAVHLHHPSGWVIECAHAPSCQWIAQLITSTSGTAE